MVEQQSGVDTEGAIEPLLVPFRPRGDVAHRVHSGGLEPARVARPEPPEIRQRPVLPELLAVALLVQLGNAHAVRVRLDPLGHDIHGDLAEIEIRADPGRRRDPGLPKHVRDHPPGQLPCRQAVGLQIGRCVNEHLVDRIDVNVLRGDIAQIDLIDPRADVDIPRHLRLRDDIIQLERRVAPQLRREAGLPGELPSGRALPPHGIDLAHALHDLEQPRAAGDAMSLERRRHGEADGLFRPRSVRNDEIRRERIKPALHAFHRGKKRFQIDRKTAPLPHCNPPFAFLYGTIRS